MEYKRKFSDKRLLRMIQAKNKLALVELYYVYFDSTYRRAYYLLKDNELSKHIVFDLFTRLLDKKTDFHSIEEVEDHITKELREKICFKLEKHNLKLTISL